MGVTVHFVARPHTETTLEGRLRSLGFKNVRRLPGSRHVLIDAEAEELSDRLNIVIEWKERSRLVTFQKIETRYPDITDSSNMPEPISELVESVHTPPPAHIS